MAKTSRILIPVALVAALAGGLYFWSQGEGAPQSAVETIEEHPLLHKLPEGAVAFYSWKGDDESYRKLVSNSAFKGAESILEQFENAPLDPKIHRLFRTFIETLYSSGLLSTDPSRPDGLKEFLVFLAGTSESPQAGMYLTATEHIDLTQVESSLRSALEKEQVPVKEVVDGARRTLTVGEGPISIVASFEPQRGALTTAPETTAHFFNEQTSNGFQALKSNASVLALLKQHDGHGSQYGMGIADLGRLAKLAPPVPDAPANPDDLPFGMASIAQFAGKGFETEAILELAPKNDRQRHLIENLSKPISGSLSALVPADAALFFGLDGQLIQTVQEGALSELTPEERAAFEPWTSTFKGITAFGMGALAVSKESLVPDIYIVVKTSDAAKLASMIKQHTTDMLNEQLPGINWMQKNIEGTPTEYIVTPLGIGLYLASTPDSVIASSSEKGIQVMLSHKDSKADLNEGLVTAFLDFAKLGDAIESVQGSMAVFTGGATMFNAEEVQNVKKLGRGSFSGRIKGNYLSFDWDLTPAQ